MAPYNNVIDLTWSDDEDEEQLPPKRITDKKTPSMPLLGSVAPLVPSKQDTPSTHQHGNQPLQTNRKRPAEQAFPRSNINDLLRATESSLSAASTPEKPRDRANVRDGGASPDLPSSDDLLKQFQRQHRTAPEQPLVKKPRMEDRTFRFEPKPATLKSMIEAAESQPRRPPIAGRGHATNIKTVPASLPNQWNGRSSSGEKTAVQATQGTQVNIPPNSALAKPSVVQKSQQRPSPAQQYGFETARHDPTSVKVPKTVNSASSTSRPLGVATPPRLDPSTQGLRKQHQNLASQQDDGTTRQHSAPLKVPKSVNTSASTSQLSSVSTPLRLDFTPQGLGTSPKVVPISETQSHHIFKEHRSQAAVQLPKHATAFRAGVPNASTIASVPRVSARQPLFSSFDGTSEDTTPISTPATSLSANTTSARKAVPTLTTGTPSQKEARKFDNSHLHSRTGQQWTKAEMVLVAYLHEFAGRSWSEIDAIMGRTHNGCCTIYSRKKPPGLKTESVRSELQYMVRIRALTAILHSKDIDMEQAVAMLQRNIESDALPGDCVQEFNRLTGLSDEELTQELSRDAPMRTRTRTRIEHRLSPTIESDPSTTAAGRRSRREQPTRVQSRTRFGHVDLARDQEELSSRNMTPDSVIASSSDNNLVQKKAPAPSTLPLFSGYNEAPQEYEGWLSERRKPYLTRNARKLVSAAMLREPESAMEWKGTTVHLSFTPMEMTAIGLAIDRICPELNAPTGLKEATDAQISAIARVAKQDPQLHGRSLVSIKSMLAEYESAVNAPPVRMRIAEKNVFPQKHNLSSRLLKRESTLSRSYRIRDALFADMRVRRTFTGASSDITVLAWSPNNTHFAAGSVCLVDSNSMQYNRPNNLLLGNIEDGRLYEVPDHYQRRVKATTGVNSTQAMHVTQDSRLFQTVTAVDFSNDGSVLFSTGYDNHLRSFKLDNDRYEAVHTHDYGTGVDLLAMHRYSSVLATGSRSHQASVKVFRYDEYGRFSEHASFFSPRSLKYQEKLIMPSSLKWGIHSSVKDMLLAGYSSNYVNDRQVAESQGEICIWDVTTQQPVTVLPAAGDTFDCKWSPSNSCFATACSAYGSNVSRWMKSFVRLFNPGEEQGRPLFRKGFEMDCSALDINDVVFNPYNSMHIAVGATDGSVHVWDLRNPDVALHRLQHGEAALELDADLSREQADTGVQFCTWTDSSSKLYTGSSDGVLKLWDVNRSAENAHTRDLATFGSGIMSGAFTDDFSKLLIGEVDGSLNMLEIGISVDKSEPFVYCAADVEQPAAANAEEDSGIATARSMLQSRQIETKPWGGFPKKQAVQGPAYSGPWDKDYSPDGLMRRDQAQAYQARMRPTAKQCSIAACKESHSFTVNAEDSGRSQDRIPQSMRVAVEQQFGMTNGVMTKKEHGLAALKCTHCGAKARVREDDLEHATLPLCERCSFACLRCGDSIKVSARVEEVRCRSCNAVWSAGVLGYDLVGHRSKMDARAGFDIRGKIPGFQSKQNSPLNNMEDLLSLVEEYHHSLWEDRVVED